MTDAFSNDNQTVRAMRQTPDPQGQAAILLVESLLHGLIARSVVSIEDAAEIIDVAAEVKVEVAAEADESIRTMEKSLTILQAIKASLANDMTDAPTELLS